jgi:solute:Na+ symporter, SSS family
MTHAVSSLLPYLASGAIPTTLRYHMTTLDIIVVAIPVLLAFVVSLYMRKLTRGVADYLAANRTAGRYVISTAQMTMGLTALGVVSDLEVFSQCGFSLGFWNGFIGFFYFLLAMSGLITYRFRETRALTFHQFFEIRYSKGLRVFATFLNVFSGLFTFGIGPGIAARFFVYYMGMPPMMHMFGMTFPTFALVMIVVMTITLYFTFAGGQLTVMTTDCIEGVISSFLYLVVAIAILCIFSYNQMGAAMFTGQPGMSYVDPFDIAKRPNFNYVYILLGWAMNIYYWRGNAWNPAFNASAKTAHESQMSVIIGIWRGMGAGAMGGLIGLGAFTLMHNPDAQFAATADAVRSYLQTTIPDSDIQLRTQLLLPTALGVMLPTGVKGALCAVLLMGLIGGMSANLHTFSGGLIQDVILPNMKRRLTPERHILVLRLAAVGIAVFGIIFSLNFKIPDYLVMVTQLLSAIYLAGVGVVVWGGLYWRRSTKQGAWASMVAGSVLAIIGTLVQQYWQQLVPFLVNLCGPGPTADWLHANALKFPINGQIIAAIVMGVCLVLFFGVSLLTCKTPYDLDKLLNRGKYRVAGEHKVDIKAGFRLSRFAGVNENFSRGDRIIAYTTFFWGLIPNVLNFGVVIWNMGIHRWTVQTWWAWQYFWSVGIPVVGGVLTTIWFTWGTTRDLFALFRDLKLAAQDVTDDGQFVTSEAGKDAPKPTEPPAKV